MRRLTPGDISARLGRIEKSTRSRRWRKAARARLLADVGGSEPAHGHMIELEGTERRVCTKRRFPTFTAAFSALVAAKRSPNTNRHEQRVYPCEGCGGWHLTSTEDRSNDRYQEDSKDQKGHRAEG